MNGELSWGGNSWLTVKKRVSEILFYMIMEARKSQRCTHLMPRMQENDVEQLQGQKPRSLLLPLIMPWALLIQETMCSEWKIDAEFLKVYSPENPGCLVTTSLASLKHISIMDPSGLISCLLKCPSGHRNSLIFDKWKMWKCFPALGELQHYWQTSKPWSRPAKPAQVPGHNVRLFYLIYWISNVSWGAFTLMEILNPRGTCAKHLGACVSPYERDHSWAMSCVFKLAEGLPFQRGIWDSSLFLWHVAQNKGPGINLL